MAKSRPVSNFDWDKAVKGLKRQRQNYDNDDANRIAAAIMNGTVNRTGGKARQNKNKKRR